MIYLYSSTARELYSQDCLDLLALPKRSIWNFRYSKSWIAQELAQGNKSLDEYHSHLNQYRGHAGVIILVDQRVPSNPSDQEVTFYPIRRVRICDCQPEIRPFDAVKSATPRRSLSA